MNIPFKQMDSVSNITAKCELLRLVRGMEQGRTTWHYVLLKRETLPMYQHHVATGQPFDLRQFGTIIESGWGENPPITTVKKIHQEVLSGKHLH